MRHYAKRGICHRHVRVCVCVCVCVSVTLQYCIETPKHWITQIMPHDSPLTLQGASIKNNPLEKNLYFSHDSSDLSQTFRVCMCVYGQHILRILLE